MARFTQHHIDMMDPNDDAVTHMRKFGDLQEDGTSSVTVAEARQYLGRFGLSGELALNPVTTLSGGQKSRLAFAGLAWKQPHLLLMDEPTNHLGRNLLTVVTILNNQFFLHSKFKFQY